MEYTGAEVTSEGFQMYGLPPYQYYSAGIACVMTGGTNSNEWMQDNFDVWNNSMDLAGITNKGIVGFKYFGFGGLAQDTNGLKAFKGVQKGDGAALNLHLTPGGHGAFKIHVLLDNPWNGQEIAVVNVPAGAQRSAQMYQVAVPAVEGLTGKHAIYLVAVLSISWQRVLTFSPRRMIVHSGGVVNSLSVQKVSSTCTVLVSRRVISHVWFPLSHRLPSRPMVSSWLSPLFPSALPTRMVIQT